MSEYIILIGLWILYGLLHSVFAANWMKRLFKNHFYNFNKYYRFIYVIFSIILLIPIIWYQSTLSQNLIYKQQTWSIFLGLSIASFGIIIIKKAFSQYDIREFIGIHQIKGNLETQAMQLDGLLSYVRHPLYSGSIIAILGFFIFAPTTTNLVTIFCFIMYFIIGIYFEEKKLIQEFGEKYLDYRRNVPALIPGWKRLFRGKRNFKFL